MAEHATNTPTADDLSGLSHSDDVSRVSEPHDVTGVPPSAEAVDWERSMDQLDDRMAVLAGRLNAVEAELVDTVAHAIETGLWQGVGYRSVTHWLMIQLGVTRAHANRLEATARRIVEFPLTADRFRDGLLSHDQVHVVVTQAPAWADVHTFDLIEHATVAQTRRIIRAQFPNGPESESLDATADTTDDEISESAGDGTGSETANPFRSYFGFGWTDEGRFTGSFDLPADAGMVLDSALAEARDALFQTGQHDVTNVDALVEIATRAANTVSSDRVERFKHYLHLDIDALIDAFSGRPGATLNQGTPVPQAVAQYLGCDATMIPVWERDCTPLGTGRSTRTVSGHLRRLVTHRDQGCRVPGCDVSLVEIHHIIHWLFGGVTETWNLVSLCSKHHRMHHAGQLNISGNPDNDTLRFTDARGRPMRTGPTPISPSKTVPTGQSTQRDVKPYRHPTGQRLSLYWMSEWKPIAPDRWCGPTELANWEQHRQRSRRLTEPALSSPTRPSGGPT